RITASAPLRSAVVNALWICVGDPSVAIVCDVHPRWLAASLTMLPCSWHWAAPQLMNTSFLPVGIGFLIGVDSVMFAGRVEPCCRICWAWLSVALAFELVLADELEVELFFDEPQAESAPAATTAVTAATTALRRDQRTTGVRVGMVAVSSLWGL